MMVKPDNTSVLQLQNREWAITSTEDENQIIHCAQQILQKRFERLSAPLTNARQVKEYLALHYQSHEREVFGCLFLDSAHRIITFENLFYGTVGQATVHLREIIRAALKHNSASIILIHNHPSGNSQPSLEDSHITFAVRNVCELMNLRLLDHFIIGKDGIFSFVEQGHLSAED